jgi:predicted N-acyltransferase
MSVPSEDSSSRDRALQSEIAVVEYDPNTHRQQWDTFVAGAVNGTAFHLQEFLAYHDRGKFNFLHLMFFEQNRLVALLPGGLSGSVFESPVGASYGSFVTRDISTATALALVEAFESYVRARGITDVYLTSPPVIYQPRLTQNLDFALLYRGYQFQRHYISHAIDLTLDEPVFQRFQATARKHIRRTLRENTTLSVEHVEDLTTGLREFYPILLENKAKYNARPTHTLEELLELNSLLPQLMKLFLVRQNGEAIAGSLIFVANARVALIFYHMLRYEAQALRPIYLLMDRVTAWATEHGFQFVDIGVSQDTSDENPMTPALSLIRFKEKFDSRGVLRSTLWKHYE